MNDVDGLYDNNLNCSWSMTANERNVIEINFVHLDIESNNTKCDFDYLQVMTF